MDINYILTLLVVFFAVGCGAPDARSGDDGDMIALVRAIDGRASSIAIGGTVVEELPFDFDLNPNLTSDRELRAQYGIPYLTKDVAILFSDRRIGENVVSVNGTPFIDRNDQPGLFLTHDVRDLREWRVSKYHKETRIITRGHDRLVSVVYGRDGHEMPCIMPGWCVIIALVDENGIVCWSEMSNDSLIDPYASGFRRFSIEGKSNTAGWQLLDPLL